VLARVAPERRTTNRYDPYPPSDASTTSHPIAPAKATVVGGVSPPSSAANTAKATAAVPVCTPRATGTLASGRQRRSSNVPAASPATARTGNPYAQAGAWPEPTSPATTSTTPAAPMSSPRRWRGVVRSPSTGPASWATTSGCSAAMRAHVPASTPAAVAPKIPPR
jgi:hypothetical protein